MVTYKLQISYKSGESNRISTFTLYKYGSIYSFVQPDGYKIPDPEYTFSLEPFIYGKSLNEETNDLFVNEVRKNNIEKVTKILGYQLLINSIM